MKKIFFSIIIAIIVFSVYFHLKFKTAEKIEKYNILYITGDSFRPDHLNCYGYNKRITSPAIDSIAKSGVLFKKMINPSGWTNQNLVSIFSSLDSPIHKVVCRQRNIDSKWHLPLEILASYGYSIPRLQPWQNDQNHSFLGFDDYINMEPDKWIEENHDKPFFLWYQFLQPHLPYDSTDTHIKQFVSDDLYKNSESKERMKNTVIKTYLLLKGKIEFKPEDKEPMDALYDAEIKYMDEQIQKLLDMLDKYNLRDKTIIVIGADHGEELLDHNFVGHASTSGAGHLYDEIIHTPFIISFPKKLPQNIKIPYQASGIDIMPTILELLNLKPVEYLRGKSLISMITGKEQQDRTVFSETSRSGYNEPNPEKVTDYISCVRTSEWKLIHYQYEETPSRFELYNIKSDPAEQNNVIDSNPEIVKDLKKQLFDWHMKCEQIYPPEPKLNLGVIGRIKSFFGIETKIDLTGVPSPPQFIFPETNGQYVDYNNLKDGVIEFKWSGKNDVPYIIEYKVGKGDYYLDGKIKVTGNSKKFGSFSRSYWDTYLVVRNPFKIRVSIDKDPLEFSDWTEVNLK
ncbi:sulfatase [Candidatus Dependentiae bacterium]|nr:sulfatase [Candidatus Dependentiae bacterium]